MISDADCDAVGLGSNPGEDMDVCKCIVPLRHGGTLNSRRAASPLVWLVEGSMPKLGRWRWVVSQSIVPSGDFAELIRTVTCMVLKANDRRTSSPLPR
ncbi:hypothetical protein TNCV_3562001 [Trichonephila clavipes]|nr:hypothetical protein TNCV_3562001 [Trichonephila clavipes]